MGSLSDGLYNARQNKSFTELYGVLDGLDPAVGGITAGRRFVKNDGSVGDASLNDLIRCAEQIVEQTLVENPEADFSTDQYAQKVLSKLVELDARASSQVLTKRHAKIRRVWAQRLGNLFTRKGKGRLRFSASKQERLEKLYSQLYGDSAKGEVVQKALLILRAVGGKNENTAALRMAIEKFRDPDQGSAEMLSAIADLDETHLNLAKKVSKELEEVGPSSEQVLGRQISKGVESGLLRIAQDENDRFIDTVLEEIDQIAPFHEEDSVDRLRSAISAYKSELSAEDPFQQMLEVIMLAEPEDLQRASQLFEQLTLKSGGFVLRPDLELALALRDIIDQQGKDPSSSLESVVPKMLDMIAKNFDVEDVEGLKRAIKVNHTGEDGNLIMMINAFLEADEYQLQVCNLLMIALNPKGKEPEDDLVMDLE